MSQSSARRAQNRTGEIVTIQKQDELVNKLIGLIKSQPRRSILLTGEAGVGKSTIISQMVERLSAEGWNPIVATASDILAGQRYIGDLEQNVKQLLGKLSKKKTLWIAPRFHDLFYAGRHEFSPVSVLDLVWNSIISGRIAVVGESQQRSYEQLVRLRPQIRQGIEIVTIPPMSHEETLDLARSWCRLPAQRDRWRLIGEDELNEAAHLANHYLGSQARPGSLINFLKLTAEHAAAANRTPISADSLVASLSSLTGLPPAILSDNQALNLNEVRTFFFSRVIGQNEAVEAMVDRIAMIKAGLTDPSRPAGVFLFVGPTGTGKTELAKALALYLFGDESRMIRLDMSEFQTAISIERILGSPSDVSMTTSLVDQIRSSPFSVILLDEFEKAAGNVWDLFLQLFDDGRLTNPQGETADFRHAIIIMTSNLGSSVPSGVRLGFIGEAKEFSNTGVSRIVEQTFRPEFLNRIDRIITFQPLSRSVLRKILLNELERVMQRRGFRRRQWAIEYEESALDYLMEMGFSAHLGARPLKRAVERYLLAPLAEAIVEHRFPEGDQFLFIRRGRQGLTVEFVDPDEPDIDWRERKVIEEQQQKKVEQLTLSQIALSPVGELAEYEFLREQYARVQTAVNEKTWVSHKAEGYEQMSQAEFWQRSDRFEILGALEYQDRLEAYLESTASLLERLRGKSKPRLSYPASTLRSLAMRLRLASLSLDAFAEGDPQDCYLRISPSKRRRKGDEKEARAYFERLNQMYRQWAVDRRMKWDDLYVSDSERERERIVAISGFAAFPILQHERGRHIWEYLENPNQSRRITVQVSVVPQPTTLEESTTELDAARRAFGQVASDETRVVRRYCREPSPLVRDMHRGWRSGRLETVLAGDFDLFD